MATRIKRQDVIDVVRDYKDGLLQNENVLKDPTQKSKSDALWIQNTSAYPFTANQAVKILNTNLQTLSYNEAYYSYCNNGIYIQCMPTTSEDDDKLRIRLTKDVPANGVVRMEGTGLFLATIYVHNNFIPGDPSWMKASRKDVPDVQSIYDKPTYITSSEESAPYDIIAMSGFPTNIPTGSLATRVSLALMKQTPVAPNGIYVATIAETTTIPSRNSPIPVKLANNEIVYAVSPLSYAQDKFTSGKQVLIASVEGYDYYVIINAQC